MRNVFIVESRGFAGLGLVNMVGGGGAVAAPTGSGSGGGSTPNTDSAFTFTKVPAKTTTSTAGQTLIGSTVGQSFTTAQALAAAQAREAQQRATTVAPWLQELEQHAADSRQLVLGAEEQWKAVLAATADVGAFVEWVSSRRTRADGNLQRGQILDTSIQAKAMEASTLTRARTALMALQGSAGRLAELERWGAEKMGGTMVVSAATAGFKFPTWGYVVGGVAIIGAALYFGGK